MSNIDQSENWGKSVGGVLIKDNKVLLARHTYGSGKGMLIVPGGYIKNNESPEQAIIREYQEETGLTVRPNNVIAVRFNYRDWYVVFELTYVSGKACSDGNENSEVIWLDVEKAVIMKDVAKLSKMLIKSVIKHNGLSKNNEYKGRPENGESSLYESL